MLIEKRQNSFLFGANAPYVEEQYETYLSDPASVTDEWRAWFDALIANADRSWRNPNLLFWHGALYLIDHGAALTFQHRGVVNVTGNRIKGGGSGIVLTSDTSVTGSKIAACSAARTGGGAPRKPARA